VTARGQVTFRKEVLQHLGIKPGEKIELALLPDGRGVIQAARPTGSIKSFIGLLAGHTRKMATLEQIGEAAASGWAGRRRRSSSTPTSWFARWCATTPHKRARRPVR
jgi:bifunctional DNA-binding transcriptional regulator/antitoxin component of YhaV-PrlF toxin-antitoxin module